jgi:hypothetical protein
MTQQKTRKTNERMVAGRYKTPFTRAKEQSEEHKKERSEY